jgi:exosortase
MGPVSERIKELGQMGRDLVGWARRNPLSAVIFAAVIALIIYFFGFLRLYAGQRQAIWQWAWMRFLPQYNQEHSKLIPLIVLGLVWYHRKKIRETPKAGSNLGLLLIGFGIFCYVAAVRALQPRVAIFGFPFLILGIVLFLWGKQLARVVLFPAVLLFFMIPLGAIEQMTFRLQFISTGIVTALGHLFGLGVHSIGTAIYPNSGNWGFDIAEGCSGIRSLIAMIMITAVYVHVFEPKLWKKITILCFSVLFAIIGNAGRLFTIIVVAKLGFPKFAGGMYHDWSDWVFFPIALITMLGFAHLLNINFKTLLTAGTVKTEGRSV